MIISSSACEAQIHQAGEERILAGEFGSLLSWASDGRFWRLSRNPQPSELNHSFFDVTNHPDLMHIS